MKISEANFTLDNSSTKQLTAIATYLPVGSVDVTHLAKWGSTNSAVVKVSNITNKGLVTAVADSGTADITVVYGITNDKVTVTAAKPPVFEKFTITGTNGNVVDYNGRNQLQTVEKRNGIEKVKKDIDSSAYVCTVADTVTAITITGNCLINGVHSILEVDITITNNNADIKTETIKFKVI